MKNTFGLKKRQRFDTFRPTNDSFAFLGNVFFALLVAFFIVLGIFAAYSFFLAPPAHFPSSRVVNIENGATLAEVAEQLERQSYIRSPRMLEWSVMFFEGERNVVAGSYYFKDKIDTVEIARRLTNGVFGFTPTKITFPEGLTVSEMARLLDEELPVLSPKRFERLASAREGFLFPDTYEFFPNVRSEKVIEAMSENFEKKTKDIQEELADDPERSLRDVVIMASILEEEGNTTENREVIAGILWKRLEADMPLQVDATFAYFTSTSTFELTREDLKIDSPYNTYLYKGLPVGPITNPGLDSLSAAMNPVDSPYWYYLSDRDGNVYFSQTLERHNELKEKYLK